ncbi:MAG: winged helix DNA-binding protein [Clostridia bacterium]
MQTINNQMIETIRQMYDMEAFSPLMEFCQGEMRTLNYLLTNRNVKTLPSNISSTLNVSRSRTTATLTSLRRKGYINMEILPSDRRCLVISLTKEGTDYIIEKLKQAENYIGLVVTNLGQENAIKLIDLLKLIVDITKRNEA